MYYLHTSWRKTFYSIVSDILSFKRCTRLFSGHCAFQVWLNIQLNLVQGKARGTKVNDEVQERSQMYKHHDVIDLIICFSVQISAANGEDGR